MRFTTLGFAGAVLVMSAAPALAHHSFAMFDAAKSVKLDGTVKEFEWTNPHSWILMMVKNQQGVEEEWAIETGTPAGLAHQGWVPNTLTPGMKIAATIHPLKDGKHAGRLISVNLPDGTLKRHPYPLGLRTS